MRGLAIALLLLGCGSEGVRLSVDLRTDYAPGVEFNRVEVDIGGDSDTAMVGEGENFLRGVRVADLRVSKGLQEGTVRLYTPLGVLLAERGVRIMIDSRFGTTVTVDRSCEDVSCPMGGGDVRAVSCLGGRCVDPLCVTGEEETCPDPQCATDGECPSAGCGMGRCQSGTCLLEGGTCDAGFYCAGTECRRRPVLGDAGTDGGSMDGGNELCGMPCAIPEQRCARAEFDCGDGVPVCRAVGPADAAQVCRVAAGECDVEERCDGTNLECPSDSFSTTVCRPSRGACDPAESCDGSGPNCPSDELAAGTVCRSADAECDVEEVCAGDSVDCPIDEFAAFGTPCSDGSCNGLGDCTDCVDGAPCSTGNVCEQGVQDCTDMVCAPAGPSPDDTLCRAASGACDEPETCSGETTCPDDGFAPAGFECRPPVGPCDIGEACTGSAPSCPADVTVPDGDFCGSASGCGSVAQCVAGSCVAGDESFCAVSLAFDGVDDVAVLPYVSGDEITIEAFIGTPAAGALVGVSGAWALEIRPSDGRTHDVIFRHADVGCVTPGFLGSFDAEGVWIHLAIWFDLGTGRATIFADGVMLGSSMLSGMAPAGELLFGTDSLCIDTRAYAGQLANVRIWNRFVSEEELRTNAGGEDPAVTAGLTQWYRIDENTGQRLFDDAGGFFGVRGRDATPEPSDPRWVPGP